MGGGGRVGGREGGGGGVAPSNCEDFKAPDRVEEVLQDVTEFRAGAG